MAGRCADVNGFWIGETSQEKRIRFEIRHGGLAMLWFDWAAPECGAQRFETTTWSPILPLQLGIEAELTEEDSSGPIVYELTGDFADAETSSGSLTLSYAELGCTSEIPLTWSATKVSCGDGKVDWSETCDDRNTFGNDGCSIDCQLPVIAEKEPNDAAPTESPFGSDALFFGSIVPAGDTDTYLIGPSTAANALVRIELHGPVMGTCGIETQVHTLDASGAQRLFHGGGLGGCVAFAMLVTNNGPTQLTILSPTTAAGYHLFIDFDETDP